jgi:hypothetical protein
VSGEWVSGEWRLGWRCFADELADLFEFGGAGAGAPFEESGFGGGERGAGGIHAAEGDIVIDLPASRDGVGGDIDTKTFAQQIVNGLTDADVGFDAADEDFPDAAVAPICENLAAFGAAKGELAGNWSQALGQLRRRRSEALRILLGGGDGDAEDFCTVDQTADVPDEAGMTGNEREQFGLDIDDEESRVVAVHELGAAEERRFCHACQNSWEMRSAECELSSYICHLSLVICHLVRESASDECVFGD